MKSFTIEKGVPAPVARRGQPAKYPIKDLKKGESFFVPETDGWKLVKLTLSLRTCVYSAKKYNPEIAEREFKVATVEGGVRVWRTA